MRLASLLGIGKAIALRLARDGFDIVVNDIKANQSNIDATVKEVEKIGRKATGIAADVSNFDEVKAMIEEIAQKHGKLDVAVANAGIAAVKQLKDHTAADLQRMVSKSNFSFRRESMSLKSLFLMNRSTSTSTA